MARELRAEVAVLHMRLAAALAGGWVSMFILRCLGLGMLMNWERATLIFVLFFLCDE